ncbi:hypothetical protein KDA11_00930, partial [Candidatus Saccharibacteria bacterium]|nr:hypothetical protein [Candidatus Saccharibacteria bacterium]
KENNIGRFNANGTPYNVPGGKLAGQIIWDVAQEYGINPQVLIVMLQKEQGLITDNWPWKVQYQKAMGYACPDTAPCDTQYYGFYNQVSSAAWQLKRYIALPYKYNFQVGVTRYIQYNPNAACGGSQVYLENAATAALYNYTPYQPNAGALANMYGTADCGAYGNRNFWRYFNDWFGSTHINFYNFSQARWMQLNKDTYKINVNNLMQIDDKLLAGRQIKFVSKVYFNDEWCYRTEHDVLNFLPKCIPASDVSELVIAYEPLSELEKMKAIVQPTYKVGLRTDNLEQYIEKEKQIVLDSKVTIGATTYYVTKHDRQNNIEWGIKAMRTRETSVYEAIPDTYYRINQELSKVIPLSNTPVDTAINSGSDILFSSRTQKDGIWYYRTKHDTAKNFDKAIPEDMITMIVYEPLATPRWLVLNANAYKVNPYTNTQADMQLQKGLQILYATKVSINGKLYLRTKYDTQNNYITAIPAEYINDIAYEPMLYPRQLVTKTQTIKVIPNTEQPTGQIIPAGTSMKYVSKIIINGITYLRTDTDSQSNKNEAIRYDILE